MAIEFDKLQEYGTTISRLMSCNLQCSIIWLC